MLGVVLISTDWYHMTLYSGTNKPNKTKTLNGPIFRILLTTKLLRFWVISHVWKKKKTLYEFFMENLRLKYFLIEWNEILD